MHKRLLSWFLAVLITLSMFVSMSLTASATETTVSFSDGDLDRIYFSGDTLSFNLSGLPVGSPPTGIPAGTTLRVALGIVNASGTFSDFTLFDTSALTPENPNYVFNGIGESTGWYLSRTLNADGSLSAAVSGTIVTTPPPTLGLAAVKIYVNTGSAWQNIMQGQPVEYIPLAADSKDAIVGLDGIMEMPDGVTCTPAIGSGAQDTENLRSFNAKFTRTVSVTPAVSGSIEFTGLNLMDSTLQNQLDDLDDGLIMQKIASPTGGMTSQFTMGILDSAASALASLGATVSVTSSALFDGLSTADFEAIPADVLGGSVSSLAFDDSTDTVSFNVNHFSSYTLSVTDPNAGTPLTETEHENAAAGLAGAKIYDSVTLSSGDIGALFNMSGSVLYGVLDISENAWITVTLGTTISSDANAAALALDGYGYPHVVFVNSDNDIVYRYQKADGWTAGHVFDSYNVGSAGALTSPDISIDGSGNAHIVYLDSKGGYEGSNDYSSYDGPELIYATNASGSMVKSIRYYGDGWYYYTGWGYNGEYWRPMSPSKIVVAGSDYYAGIKHDYFYRDTDPKYSYHTWSYKLFNSSSDSSYPLGSSDPGFNLYNMATDGTNVYSLFTKSGSLYVTNGVTEISAATKSFGTSAADIFVNNADSGKLYYAAVSGSTLLLYQNGSFKESLTLPALLSSTHVKLSTVVSGTTQYVLYTDTAGKLQVAGFKTTADSVAPVNTASYPKITGANASGFTIEANVDESATIFYIAVNKDAASPTSAQVAAGISYSDPAVTIRASGSFALLPNATGSKTVAGLTAATEYDVYVAAKDNEGNLQASPYLIQTITGIPAGAVTIGGVYDLNTNQDITDIRIVFGPAADETRVLAYRLFVVPEAGAAAFNLAAADAVSNAANYITVNKASISGGAYTVTLPDTAKTAAGNAVAVNTNYKLFVLSMATGTATINSLAGPSDAISAANHTGTLGGSDPTPEAGQSVTVTVTDMDENHNPTAADTLDITVISSLDATGITVTLIETGANTGIFSGTIVIDPAASNGATCHIHAYGGQTVTVRYTDVVTATGAKNVLASATTTIDPTQLTAPTLSVSGTIVSWADVDNEQGYSVQIYNDSDAAVGSAITLAADTASFDMDEVTPALGYDGYYIKVKAVGDGTRYTDSAWSASSSPVVTIRNKVMIAAKAGNPTQIINNGTYTALYYFTITGTGISALGDTNPTLKAKLPVSISNTVNCSFSGDTNAYTLTRVDNDTVEAEIQISSSAASTATGSFSASVSTAGTLATAHEPGTPGSVNVTGVDIIDPPASVAPGAADITVSRTSATAVNVSVAGLAGGNIIRVYAQASGGTVLGNAPAMGTTVTFSDLAVNSDVAVLYITKQDDANHAESTPRTAVTLSTYITALSPSGNYTFPALPEGYASGSQHTHTFTITNSGTDALTGVSAALSGADASNFEITPPAATISASGNTTFTVKAKDSLAIDTYVATVTVSTANIADKTFTVTQQVATIPALSQPSGLSVSGTTVSWNTVSDATEYSVTVKKGTTNVTGLVDVANASTSFSLSGRGLPGGSDYTVLVKATGDGINYVDSAWSDLSPATVTLPALTLSTPAGFGVSGTTISWGAASGVSAYEVDILKNGTSLGGSLAAVSTGTTASIDLSGRGLPGGSYSIRVTAKGDGIAYSDSTKSAASGTTTLPAVKLAVPTGLSVTGTAAAWDTVVNASGYQIHVVKIVGPGSDIDLGTATTTLAAYDLIGFAEHEDCVADTYSVTVTAKGDGTAYSDSDSSSAGSVVLTPKTVRPTAGAVTVTRKSDTKVDAVVTGLSSGDTVKIYAAATGGEVILTQTAGVGVTSISFTNITVTASAGSLYFTKTETGRTESDRTQKSYEQYTSSDDGGTGGGGAGSGLPASSVNTTTQNNTTTASVTTPVSTTSGTTSGSLTSGTATQLLDQAVNAENNGNKAVIGIKVETTAETQKAQIDIPRTSFDQMAKRTDADIKIETGFGTINFDARAVETINGAVSSGDIQVEIERVENNTLSETVKEVVQDRPVYDFSVSAGGRTITDFGGGSASICIPYALKEGEKPEAVVVYYIDDTGSLITVEGKYNVQTGTVDFLVEHFSVYAVGYNEVSFADVSEGAWYQNAVTFLSARGITSGTGNNMFAPEAALTRAQFLVMIMRAYGIGLDGEPSDNFADAGDTYYSGYLAAAKRLGITSGIGNNLYAPDRKISRQDMFTLLYRTLFFLEKLPEEETTGGLDDFKDADGISDYAKEAVNTMIKAKIISGSGGMLDPMGESTRAQMAQVLYNLLSK